MLSLPLAWGALRTRPAKTFFSVLGIALGVATAVAILTLDVSTVAAKSALRGDSFAHVDLEAQPSDPNLEPTDALALLRKTEGVAEVGAIVRSAVELRIEGKPAGGATLIALDATARRARAFDAYRVSLGNDLPAEDRADGPAQCLVGEELATQLGLNPGCFLELARPGRGGDRTECVDGELRRIPGEPRGPAPKSIPCQVAGFLDRYHLGKQAGGSIVVVPLPLVSRIAPQETLGSIFWISKTPSTAPEKLKAALTPAFAYATERSAIVGEAADERAFRNGVRVSGVLALILGLFVIFHTLAMSLVERVREIAILNAIGATRGQIGKAFLAEAAIVSFSGAALGVGIGIGLARVFMKLGYTTLGQTHKVSVLEVPWTPVLALGGVGAVVALLGAVFPLIKARAIYPARVLAQRDLGRSTDLFRGLNVFVFSVLALVLPLLYFFVVPVLGEATRETGRVLVLGGVLFVIFLGFLLLAPRTLAAVCKAVTAPFTRWRPLEGFLASRAMTEGISRVAISAAVLALVGAALVTLKGITGSLRGEVSSWGENVVHKVFFTPQSPIERARVEKLREIPGVEGFESLGVKLDSPFLIRALRVADSGPVGPLRDPELRARFEAGDSILLSKPLARSLRASKGSEISVGVAWGPPRKLQVLAVSDELGYAEPQREYGVVCEAWMKRYCCMSSDLIDKFAVRLTRGTDPGAAASMIGARFSDLPAMSVKTGRAVRDYAVEDIDTDFRLFDLILVLVAMLAGVGVLNALLLAALERRKEIGVMKALGMTRGQLAGTVLLEAMTTGVVGGIFGAALGLAFSFVAIDALARLTGLPLATTIEPQWLAAALGGAVALAIGASAFPILRANRFSAAEAVRYE